MWWGLHAGCWSAIVQHRNSHSFFKNGRLSKILKCTRWLEHQLARTLHRGCSSATRNSLFFGVPPFLLEGNARKWTSCESSSVSFASEICFGMTLWAWHLGWDQSLWCVKHLLSAAQLVPGCVCCASWAFCTCYAPSVIWCGKSWLVWVAQQSPQQPWPLR